MTNHPFQLCADLTPQQLDLWHKVAEFSFDPDSARKSFSSRLADQQGWTQAFTARVLHEYRRFLFLSAVAGHVVCPSEEIDAAWHQHLIYSRSYWDDLCRSTLGRPLHHDPTAGGPEESRKHWSMYRQTLVSYRRIFGEEAPADIWPPPLDRFDPHSQPRVVNARDYWILRKPNWWPGRLRRKTVVAAGVFPLAVGLGPLDLRGPEFLLLFFGLFAMFYAASIVYSRIRREIVVTDDRDLTAEEIACLNYGRPAAVNATIARMLHGRELMAVGAKGWFGTTNGAQVKFAAGAIKPSADSPLAAAIHKAVEPGALTLHEVQSAVAAETESIDKGLQEAGYLLDKSRMHDLRLVPGLAMFGLLGLGIAKIIVGISRGRPVGFLILGCIVTVVAFVLTFAFIRRSLAGDRMVRLLKTQHDDLRTRLDFSHCTANSVAMCAAIYGATALQGTAFDDFKAAWKQNSAHAGGGSFSGCGTGCGGGGGGGGGGCGGGGCGGCGGG